MALAIIQLITEFLKLVFVVINSWVNWNAEERKRFEERIILVTDLLKKAVDNKADVISEKDFLSNLEWEAKARYTAYRDASLAILVKGGGIEELKVITTLGMGQRVIQKQEDIVLILVKDITIEGKAVLIAKALLA